MPLSDRVLGWRQFGAMPLYLQFFVGVMVLYASGMTGLTVLIALDGGSEAAYTFAMALFVWVFALVVVPSRLGSVEATVEDG